MNEVEKAKEVLRKAGYAIGTMWHIEDVRNKFPDANDIQAADILERAMANPATYDQIRLSIEVAADVYYPELKPRNEFED